MTCRKEIDDGQNRGRILIPGRGWRVPAYWPTGLRHIHDETAMWALVWNVGICRSDAKGACQVGSPRKALSTKALHRGGSSRSRSNEKIGRYFASCTHSLDLVRMYNTLYLGLDAHTRNCVLATMNSPVRVVSTREFSTSETALIRYVTELPARSKHLMLEESSLAGVGLPRHCVRM